MNEEESKRVLELCEQFEDHLERFEQHEVHNEQNYNKLIEAQRVNTESIHRITHSIEDLVNDTKSIVQLHKDFQGAARLGNGLQKFLVWVLKWGAIGTGTATAIIWVTDHFNK